MITILDLGIGNIGSIINIINYIGEDCKVATHYKDIRKADKLILPGVGSFDTGMNALFESSFLDPLNEFVLIRKCPILGICLGMQMMCSRSEEGKILGLNWIDADVMRFSNKKLPIPHMGWNTLVPSNKKKNFFKTLASDRFYFVHSYFVNCHEPKDVLYETCYENRFVSAFMKENIIGVQFHPEKSHIYGMNFLKSFSKL
jgi:glutamine amidotransferase